MKRRKKKKQRKIIILSTVFLSFIMITAYSAFSTKLSLNAKGNIITEHPTDGLLLYLDAENRGEDSTKWKDLSPNKNDCTLRNFNNTTESGWQEKNLVFDGIDDNVLCGEINPDNFTIIVTGKILKNQNTNYTYMLGNWEGGGYGITINGGQIYSNAYITDKGYIRTPTIPYEYNNIYTFIHTFNGQNISFSANDTTQSIEAIGTIEPPAKNTLFMVGANPKGTELNYNDANGALSDANPSNIEVYSVLIYDHALTNEQINKIKVIEKEKYF